MQESLACNPSRDLPLPLPKTTPTNVCQTSEGTMAHGAEAAQLHGGLRQARQQTHGRVNEADKRLRQMEEETTEADADTERAEAEAKAGVIPGQ